MSIGGETRNKVEAIDLSGGITHGASERYCKYCKGDRQGEKTACSSSNRSECTVFTW